MSAFLGDVEIQVTCDAASRLTCAQMNHSSAGTQTLTVSPVPVQAPPLGPGAGFLVVLLIACALGAWLLPTKAAR